MKRFLRLLESSWDCKVHTSLFPKEIGESTFDLLCKEGVLEASGQAETYPCPGGGRECPRIIVPMSRNKETPFLAICGDRRTCMSQPLREEETHLGLNRRRWVETLRLLYALDGPISCEMPGFFGLSSIGHANEADIFLAEKSGGFDPLKFLIGREAMARPTRLLVPTSKPIDPFIAQRYGRGARAQIIFLEDELAIRDDAIVLLRSEPTETAPPASPSAQPIHLPQGTTWRDVRLYRIDGHTLSVRAGSFHKRVTYIDLGMASAQNREPTKQWDLLMALCDDGSTLRWHGDAETVRRQVSYLRARLREAFGLKDDPFERYAKGRGHGWQSRFRAVASDVDEAS